MNRCVISSGLILAALAVSTATAATAYADGPGAIAPAPVDPDAIYGGDAVGTCGWPTTVYLGGCTGTLVHPRLVIYAQHCGAAIPQVMIGEDDGAGLQRVVETERCELHPEPSAPLDGTDIAYCVLSEAVEDVPIVPVLAGCEVDALAPGRKSTLVGFGVDENNISGVKREVTTVIEGLPGNEILVGGDGKDACYGDSGGPAYIRLDPDTFPGGDGSWRVYGVTSYGKSCGGSTYYTMIHPNLEWVESSSGIDVTPCHDADGTWNPSARCQGFPISPGEAGGSWDDGCGGGPVSGWSEACGAAFPQPVDEVGPVVEITAPGDGSVFETEENSLPVYIRVESDDGDGWGFKQHWLLIDGEPLPIEPSSVTPLEFFTLKFPQGTFVLSARSLDYAGNMSESAPVTITIGQAPTPVTTGPDEDPSGSMTDDPTTDASSGGENSESGDPEGSTGEGTDGGESGDDGGCGCRSGARGPSAMWLLVLAPFVRRRRRA